MEYDWIEEYGSSPSVTQLQFILGPSLDRNGLPSFDIVEFDVVEVYIVASSSCESLNNQLC